MSIKTGGVGQITKNLTDITSHLYNDYTHCYFFIGGYKKTLHHYNTEFHLTKKPLF